MQWKYRIVKGLLLYYSTTPQVAKVLEFQDNLLTQEGYFIYQGTLMHGAIVPIRVGSLMIVDESRYR